jgi:hypothetical protein
LRLGAAQIAHVLGSGGRQSVEVAGRAALRHLLLPRSLDIPAFGEPDEDGVDRAGFQAQRPAQVVAVAPVRRLRGQRIEDGDRLWGGTAHSGHGVILYLDRVVLQALRASADR